MLQKGLCQRAEYFSLFSTSNEQFFHETRLEKLNFRGVLIRNKRKLKEMSDG